jgi:hypothetical protein
MFVLADGLVMPCCYAQRELGNLKDASLEEIWNGPVAVELRAFIKRNEVHPVCDGAICKFVQNMKKTAEIERLRSEYAAIKASTSWRITAPLRVLSSMMRRGGNMKHSPMHGENLQAEIERLRSEYAAIKASTSWRITAPLRVLSAR